MNVGTRLDEMREQCQSFHEEHPKVWELFVRYTFELIDRGFANYSVNGVFERIRWESDEADIDGRATFKLNNNYRPFYARRFMKVHPEFDYFFRTRVQTSKVEPATGREELVPQDFEYEK